MGTYYKQIGVYKTTKALLEFIDDTRYDTEVIAWPHLRTSRIRIGMKVDAVNVFYNLSPEEFIRLAEVLNEVKQVSAVERKRWELSNARLGQAIRLYQKVQMPEEQLAAVRELIEQFSSSRNEVFAEAGQKLSDAFERLVADYSTPIETGMAQAEKILADAKKECENTTKVREIYNDMKILNYDKYINPENETERRVTSLRVAYSANMGFPFIFEIGNGWGKPFITKKGGTMVEKGQCEWWIRFRYLFRISICSRCFAEWNFLLKR